MNSDLEVSNLETYTNETMFDVKSLTKHLPFIKIILSSKNYLTKPCKT